ncbi:MAG: hypothetical protein AAB802_04285, partial [Patescibacteria group bacterium]
GMSRQTLYLWLKNDLAFRQELHRYEWEDLQHAEFILKAKALAGSDIRALTFFLQRKHPDYGSNTVKCGNVEPAYGIDTANKNRLDAWKLTLNQSANAVYESA